jgi:hypothetical protein
MSQSFTPSPFQSIMEPEKLTPPGIATLLTADSQDVTTIKEPCFMLPENRPLDYRISTPTTEDEFECDECCSTRYQLRDGIPSLGIQPYVLCLECGWQRPNTVEPQSVYQGFKPIPIPPRACIYCKGAVDGCWQCNDTVAIASVGGVG